MSGKDRTMQLKLKAFLEKYYKILKNEVGQPNLCSEALSLLHRDLAIVLNGMAWVAIQFTVSRTEF